MGSTERMDWATGYAPTDKKTVKRHKAAVKKNNPYAQKESAYTAPRRRAVKKEQINVNTTMSS